MTIELSLLISGISVAFAIFFGIRDQTRNSRKDTKEEAREDATIITKLEAIQTNMLEVKSEVRSYREEMKDIREHIARDNESLKSLHKRVDGIEKDSGIPRTVGRKNTHFRGRNRKRERPEYIMLENI